MLLPNYTFKAFVTNVIDGDTIDVDIDVGFNIKMRHRIRLLGVNTAEMTSKILEEKNLAIAAKQYTFNSVLNKEIILTTQKSDAFGRYLGEVFYIKNNEQVSLNKELLSLGLAREFKA